MTTVWQVLNRWSLNPIPTAAPASVINVPRCHANDLHLAEVSFGDTPLFLPPDQVRLVRDDPAIASSLPYINDDLLGRLYAAFPTLQTGFRAERSIPAGNGMSQVVNQRFGLCREENPAVPPIGNQSPGYQMYVSPMVGLNNVTPGDPLQRSIIVLDSSLTQQELAALTRSPLLSDTSLYSVSSEDPISITINNNLLTPQNPLNEDLRGPLALWIANHPNVFPDGDRRQQIIDALNLAGTNARNFNRSGAEAHKGLTWQLLLGGAGAALGALGLGVAVYQTRKMKQISVEAAVAAARATQEDAKAREVTDEKTAREILGGLGEDMLAKAGAGEYVPYIEPHGGDRIVRLQNQLKANNVSMLWNAGGGKTALAEGLAQHLADFPGGKRVMYSIDLTKFESSTQFRGNYARNVEELRRAIEYLRSQGNEVYIFIDEVAQKGAESSAMDGGQAEKILNALKPYLAKSNGFLIAAVQEEWNRTLGKDPAVVRRFKPFDAQAYTEPQVREIMLDPRLRKYMTSRFGERRIGLSDGAVDTVLELAKAFFPDESLISASGKVAKGVVAPREFDSRGRIDVSPDQVYRRFAADNHWTVDQLRERIMLIDRLGNLRKAYRQRANLNLLTGQSLEDVRLTPNQAREVMNRWEGLPEADRSIYQRFSWGENVGEYPRSFIEATFPTGRGPSPNPGGLGPGQGPSARPLVIVDANAGAPASTPAMTSVAARPGEAPPITEQVFTEMIHARFPRYRIQGMAGDVQQMARNCTVDFRRSPQWTNLSGDVRLPAWDFVERHVQAYINVAERRGVTTAGALRTAFDQDRRLDRPGVDRLPEEIRDIGREAYRFSVVP